MNHDLKVRTMCLLYIGAGFHDQHKSEKPKGYTPEWAELGDALKHALNIIDPKPDMTEEKKRVVREYQMKTNLNPAHYNREVTLRIKKVQKTDNSLLETCCQKLSAFDSLTFKGKHRSPKTLINLLLAATDDLISNHKTELNISELAALRRVLRVSNNLLMSMSDPFNIFCIHSADKASRIFLEIFSINFNHMETTT